MEQSAVDFTQSLSRASDEIGRATVMLKNQFREQQLGASGNSDACNSGDEQGSILVVDPIEMVKRLQILQCKIETIQQVSSRLVREREELVGEVAASLRENVSRVHGLELRAGENANANNGLGEGDQQAWIDGQHILDQCITVQGKAHD
mmetsp:Transcript_23521/g.35286  ORF Transcript_23521/g.35286 Transcript_23521/m.35286 type:complete len:149 (-) Transcript_23521:533-979(-)|eukprot:CAMPEP_0116026612 /NCGR_PEP_ID=MMETSP0321-20121206/13982_1 /TAXON_ID=163516 /ORGANISM="Leptocylindrus danicus var. danicus, Strain B650" /LENGTH=148 /DNA_ID=CAMNT_0003499499 /DNA_START=118 /DNA_END=564 /DNA_ORIENTATION=+